MPFYFSNFSTPIKGQRLYWTLCALSATSLITSSSVLAQSQEAPLKVPQNVPPGVPLNIPSGVPLKAPQEAPQKTTQEAPPAQQKAAQEAPASKGPYMQDAALYALTFEDEFDGASLDKAKWNDHIWYEPSSSTKDYGVSGGTLKIWPQADASGKFNARILTTAGKFDQAYGYFEMEAKLPVGAGCWPAFWLLNSDSPPGEPEIDIMEAYPGDKTGYWADSKRHPIRYGVSYYQNGANQPGSQGKASSYTGDLSTAFHKYGVKWEPNKVSFYFDGKLVHSAEVSMTRKMYILLDMQYGSSSGPVDETTPLGSGNSFEISYVRAWQFK